MAPLRKLRHWIVNIVGRRIIFDTFTGRKLNQNSLIHTLVYTHFFEEMKNADLVMAANFKSTVRHIISDNFHFLKLFRLHVASKIVKSATKTKFYADFNSMIKVLKNVYLKELKPNQF